MTRTRNRVLAVLLLTAVLLSCLMGFAGCNRDDETEDVTTSVSQKTTKKKTTSSKTTDEDKTEKESEKSSSTTTEKADPNTTVSVSNATTRTTTEATTLTSGLFQVSQDYKNNHTYAIAVNTSQNIVIVYGKDEDGNYTKPVKAIACSCGRSGHETPSGQYTTLAKQRWLYLIDGTYGQYCTKFKEHYWFHSVPYYSQDPSDLEWQEYNKLGNNASAGCVRMNVRDVKWIYDNISLGTVVRVYASSAAEPLAKPATIKIDTSDSNEKRGWDPTDPDPANPYN